MTEPTPQLSRRDYFAAMAMQGIIAGRYEGCQIGIQCTAAEAVQLADAIIAELDRTTVNQKGLLARCTELEDALRAARMVMAEEQKNDQAVAAIDSILDRPTPKSDA